LNGSGGRWGSTATRAFNDQVATQLEDQGLNVINGAGRGSEEWIPGPNGGTTGGTWVDITAQAEDGSITRVQTIDTLADGVTPTAREAAAAARIRAAFPNDQLNLIPKPK
jgi:filamentous hemagglutinin